MHDARYDTIGLVRVGRICTIHGGLIWGMQEMIEFFFFCLMLLFFLRVSGCVAFLGRLDAVGICCPCW